MRSHRITLSISSAAASRAVRCYAVVRWLKRTIGHCTVNGARLRASGYFGLVLRLKVYAAQSQRSASDAPRFGVT